MNGNQILALVGLIIVVAGIFCPVISGPGPLTSNFYGDGKGDVLIALGIAAATLICIFISAEKGAIFLGIANLSLLLSALIGFQIKISGGAQMQLQWGWALLIIGSIMLFYGASEKNFVTVMGAVVIAIALGGCIAYFNYYNEAEKLRAIAQKDCDRLVDAAQKYYETESREIESLGDLNEKYITGLETLKDPWGNAYEFDNIMKKIYSKGPDSKPRTADDITAFVRSK